MRTIQRGDHGESLATTVIAMKIARQKSEKLAVILKVANIWDMLVACQHRFDYDNIVCI
jgi:hypothetical protein